MDTRALASYAKPGDYEYVSLSATARIIEDRRKIKELWTDGLRVWFPNGPDDPELVLIAVDVETAKYWTDAASMLTYAWAYVKAHVTGKRPAVEDIATIGTARF